MPTVEMISLTPVKSFALCHPEGVYLTQDGVVGDREFFLVDSEDRLMVGQRCGTLASIHADFDDPRLTMRFADGCVVAGDFRLGASLVMSFYGLRTIPGKEVEGPWAEALSDFTGRRVRLIRADGRTGFDLAPVTIVSTASIARLAQETTAAVGHRRFRMLFTVSGCRPHDEDCWDRVRLGEAVVRVGSRLGGPVPRCAVVDHDPSTGRRDAAVLRAIQSYRGKTDAGVVFGVYAHVEHPGRVRVGDAVSPV